ncbi:MAG: hypothetical protein Q4D59_03295 [Erysipelotrichaceae bacterium]|nr:hypothetical protein [Erysipelotrichaceae bacterium]
MRNRRNGSFIWIIFLIFIFSGGLSALFPLLLIIGVVMAITMGAVQSSNREESVRNESYRRADSYYRAGSTQKYSAAQMAKINVYLRSWFRTRRSLPIGSNIDLRIHGERYASLASLDVYRNNTYICSLSDFGRRYPDSYNEILKELSTLSEQGHAADAEVIDVEATDTVKKEEKKEAPKKEEKKVKGSQDFIDEINRLNDDIPDENISNGLYETCALLKQIQTLEERFPASKDKLKKLYEYYLPILVRILKQYDNLQAAQTDPSYETTKEKLTRTITLINDAMKTIISSLTDQDFINLSADISTLEAVLQKDGLTSDGQISQRRGGY